MECGVGTGN